jgi:hypothetical protein
LLVALDDDESKQKQLQNRRTTMSVTQIKKLYQVNEIYFDGISELIAKLGPRFAERAARTDEGDRFVAENFVELKAHGPVAAGVPKELGEAVLATATLLLCCVSWATTAAPRVGFFHRRSTHVKTRKQRELLEEIIRKSVPSVDISSDCSILSASR